MRRRLRTALIVLAVSAPLAVVTAVGTNKAIDQGTQWAINALGTPSHAPTAVEAAQAQITQAVTGVIVRAAASTVITFTFNLTQG
jgi:hypothetical protein